MSSSTSYLSIVSQFLLSVAEDFAAYEEEDDVLLNIAEDFPCKILYNSVASLLI